MPRGAFGPRLQAVLSLLAGAYRLGKRPIQSLAADLFGITISTGMVCKLERATSESLEASYASMFAIRTPAPTKHPGEKTAARLGFGWR